MLSAIKNRVNWQLATEVQWIGTHLCLFIFFFGHCCVLVKVYDSAHDNIHCGLNLGTIGKNLI